MTLRPDREVEALAPRGLDVRRDRCRINVEVGIDERDPLAVRRKRTRLHRVSLTEVAVVVDDADARVRASGEEPLCRAVDRAV
jgi:hypothetical protein